MNTNTNRIQTNGHRYGVTLAKGDGTRLLPLTTQLSEDERPKQFCAVIGKETLLQQTRLRVSKKINVSARTQVASGPRSFVE